MTALPVIGTKAAVTPVNLPKLRAVSNRTPLDIPSLPNPEPAPRPLRAVPVAAETQASEEFPLLARVASGLGYGLVVISGCVGALGLQWWLSL